MKKIVLRTLLKTNAKSLHCAYVRKSIFSFLILIGMYPSMPAYSQSRLCTGSTSVPVLLETFGSGPNPGPALVGITNYTYIGGYPADGLYTISNTTSFKDNPGPTYWQISGDHTGNKDGYMMVVNANASRGEFFRKQVSGLCPNTTYIFSAWAANVNTDSVHKYCDPNYFFPDILFKIEDPGGALLGSKASGKIPIDTNGLIWKEYGFSFRTPATGQTSVNLVMVNNDTGGCGNDLVIDDISFYICQPTINPITQPSKLAYCEGDSVTILGGLGPGFLDPQYQWQFSGDGGATWTDMPGDTNVNIVIKNLIVLSPPGEYRLLVAERGNLGSSTCRLASPAVLINVVPNPSVNITTNNISCSGWKDGTATANTTNGTLPYSYLWSTTPPDITQSISGLSPGIYSVIVTDKYGCKSFDTTNITAPNPLSIITNSTNALCFGTSSGTSSVTNVIGGTPAYSFQWSNGQTSQTATGLAIGSYSIMVTDANGCSATNTITITQPTALQATFTQTNTSCNGGMDGDATITVLGGTKNYTYMWSNGATSSSVSGLPAGNYSVAITDANGCSYNQAFIITQPPPITVSLSGNTSICLGGTSTLTASTTGGTPAYTYVWMPGSQSGQSISVNPTSSTTYTVITTDANNCVAPIVQTFTINVFPLPNARFDTTSHGKYNSIYAFKDLSTGGVSWFWDFGDGTTSTDQNPIHTFNGAEFYNVIQVAINQFGCTDTFRITIHPKEGIIIPNVFTPDGDGMNDVWYISNSGVKEFHVVIYNRWGLKLFETTSDEIRWDGRTVSGKRLTEGTYFFTLKALLKSGNGIKDYSTTGHITILTGTKKSSY